MRNAEKFWVRIYFSHGEGGGIQHKVNLRTSYFKCQHAHETADQCNFDVAARQVGSIPTAEGFPNGRPLYSLVTVHPL